MSTATSVISTSPRGPSFEGAPGRSAAPGGASAADGAQAVGFAGLLFSRLEAPAGERSAAVRDGETLPAGGDGLPAAKAVAESRKGEAVAEARAELDEDPEALQEAEASDPKVSDAAPAHALEPALEEVAEMVGEVAVAADGEAVTTEAPTKAEAEAEAAAAAERGDRPADAQTLAEMDFDGAGTRERNASAEEPAGGAKAAEPAAADAATAARGEQRRTAETLAAASTGADEAVSTHRGAQVAPAGEAAPASEPVAQPAQAGLTQAAAVAAEPSAVHAGVPGQERPAGEAAAVTRPEAAGAPRGQAVGSGSVRSEGQNQALAAEAGDDAEAEGEAQSRREYASGRGGGEAVSQKDGVGKADFVLPSAKELTFENPFRSLGLGVAETGSRSQGAGSAPAPSLAQLQQTYQGSATGTTSLAVAERFGTPQWGGGVTQRIMWMANQQVGRAELRLDPPELGSLTVRLNISQDQASVSFVSPHAHVRDALEQQMPRLREMLAENGLNLQDADVSDQSASRDSGEAREDQPRGGGGRGGAGESEGEGLMEAPRVASLALVDFYA